MGQRFVLTADATSVLVCPLAVSEVSSKYRPGRSHVLTDTLPRLSLQFGGFDISSPTRRAIASSATLSRPLHRQTTAIIVDLALNSDTDMTESLYSHDSVGCGTSRITFAGTATQDIGWLASTRLPIASRDKLSTPEFSRHEDKTPTTASASAITVAIDDCTRIRSPKLPSTFMLFSREEVKSTTQDILDLERLSSTTNAAHSDTKGVAKFVC